MGKVCILGNIDLRIAALGTVKKMEEACIKCINVAGDGGGHILSCGCGLPPNTPSENARTMVKIAKTYGKYPLKF